MKQIFLTLILVVLSMYIASAQIQIDGIYYNLDLSTKTAKVTSNPNKYSGSVVIPSTVIYKGSTYNVKEIGDSAFYNCIELTSITIPNSARSIGYMAFRGCINLTNISIPNGVQSIGNHAFSYCSGLISITIPNSVNSIEDYAFQNCSSLASVSIPNSVTTIKEYAFSGCSCLTSVTIPNSMTNIDKGTFQYCSGLTSVFIPNSVNSIEDYAFANCPSMTSVNIPNSVTKIGKGSFQGCYSLTSVSIPNSVTTIGDWAFGDCSELGNVYCYANYIPTTESNAFGGSSSIEYVTLHVPSTSIDEYKVTEPWSGFGAIVVLEKVLRGDVNDDSIVNGTDIQAVINLIVASLYDEKGDVNNDGTVNGTDIQEIINIIVKGDNPDEEKTMLNTPLTLEAIADGTVTFKNVATGIVIYKIDDGEAQTIAAGTTKNIPVNAGQKVTLFGDNVTYYNGANADGNRKSNISGTADFYVYGNIMSLVSSTSYATATTLTGERTFVDLFRGAVKLKNHPSKQLLLPATTLAEDCYNGMFAGCTSLTTAPALPAMSVNGYIGMFEGCTSLMAAPELPATTLGVECYAGMFSGCTSLTTAPALPATTLADYCYSEMFSGCTSLAAAPALPATTLKQGCYQYMFEDCSNLTSIKCLATDMSASSCTYNWLKNVAANGTFVKAASASWTSGKNGIPTGWTVQNEYVPSKFQGPKRVFGNNLLSSFSHSNKRYELTYNSDNFVTKVTEERLEDSGHEGYTYEYEVSYSGEQVTINRTRSDNERVRQYVITIGDNGFAESCTEGYLDSSNKTVIKFEYDSDGHVTKIIEEDDNPYGGTFTWQNGNIIKQNGIGDNRSCNYTYANISNVAGLQIRANIGSMDDYYLPELYYMGLLGMGTANLVQSYSYSNSYSEISTAENVWTLDDAGRPIKCVTTSTSYDGYTGTSNHSWSYR